MDAIAVAIDVAKDRLDVAVRPSGEVFVVERTADGLDLLIVRLKALAPQIVALEASGGFETIVTAALAAAGLSVVVVNPTQVRAFAKAVGKGPRPTRSTPASSRTLPKRPSRRSGRSPMLTPCFSPT